MRKKANHITTTNEKYWRVVKSGADRASRKFDNKSDAIKYGIMLSKKEKTDLFIHKKNGMIENSKSFSKD